jgi:hypothetical protein
MGSLGSASIFTTKIISIAGGLFLKTTVRMACAQK